VACNVYCRTTTQKTIDVAQDLSQCRAGNLGHRAYDSDLTHISSRSH